MKLIINSKDRTNTSQNTNNFTFNIQSIEYKKIRLEYFYCPLTFYNITSSNNTIIINIGASTYNVSLPVGYYPIDYLLTQLTDLLNSETGETTFLVSKSLITGLISIYMISTFSITFNTELDDYLGFTSSQTLSGTNSYTASNICRIYEPYYIKLNFNFGSDSYKYIDNQQENTTFIIEIDENLSQSYWGSNLIYKNRTNEKELSFNSVQKLNNCRVSLSNYNNEALDILNSNWYCVLNLE